MGIHPNSCLLMRKYTIPEWQDESNRGFLTGSAYGKASIRLHVSTKRHAADNTPDQLGRFRLAVQLWAESDITAADKIETVTIGGIDVSNQNKTYGDRIEDIWLSEAQTKELLARFERNELVKLSVVLANDYMLETTLYPPGNRNFDVWLAVFRTCAEENTW